MDIGCGAYRSACWRAKSWAAMAKGMGRTARRGRKRWKRYVSRELDTGHCWDTWIYRSPDVDLFSVFPTTVASSLFEYSNSRLAYASYCRKNQCVDSAILETDFSISVLSAVGYSR